MDRHQGYVVVCALVFLSFPVSVRANPLDTFGVGSRNIAMGGTGTASADSFEAAYYNPAALGLMSRLEFGVGVSIYRPWLKASFFEADESTGTYKHVSKSRFDRIQPYVDIGVAAPISLGKGKERHLFFGFHAEVPGDVLYAIDALPAQEPSFPLYESRNRRFTMNLAVAGRYKWFMIGAGVSMLPTVGGKVTVDFENAATANNLKINVKLSFCPNVGILFEPLNGLRLGLSWRGAGQTNISLPVDATLSEKITPFFLQINAITYWTPHELSFGVSWDQPRYRLAADVIYYMFGNFKMSSSEMTYYFKGSSPDSAISYAVPDPGLHDSVSVRLGAEFRPIPALALRAGLAWNQSPISVQSGESNMLGGDSWSGSAGIGFDAKRMGGPAIMVDAHLMAGAVINNTDGKIDATADNPGYPNVGGGGWYLNSGISLKFGF